MPKTKASANQQKERAQDSSSVPAVLLYIAIPLVIAGLMAWYLAASRQAAGEIGFPLDDSWIHARFAENLSQGLGFSFNPGEPTSTTTAALWTLLLAGAYRVTHEFLFTSFALNWLLCVLLCVVVYRLSLTMHASRWVALVAASVVAVTVPLPWWALSGMEPPLYAFLSLFGILLHVRLRQARGVRGLAPTVVLALAGLARPECLVLFPLAMVDRLVMARWGGGSPGSALQDPEWVPFDAAQGRPQGPRGAGVSPASGDAERGVLPRWVKVLALHLPLFLVIIAPLFVYNYRVTGCLLPSSFYSKLPRYGIAGALAGTPEVSVEYALLALPAQEMWDVMKLWAVNNGALVIPFLYGFVWLARQAMASFDSRRSVLIPMVLIVRPVAWALAAGYRPAGFQSQRYLADLNPLFLLLGVVGGARLVERVGVLRPRAARIALACAVLAASLARQPSEARVYALNVKNITEMQVNIARWLRENAPKGSLLAVNDVGAIGVITGDPVLDLQGLVTPEILPLRELRHMLDGTAPQRVFEFLAQRRPDYVVVFPAWYPEYGMMTALFTEVYRAELEDNITCGAPLMVVYRADWAALDRRRQRRSP